MNKKAFIIIFHRYFFYFLAVVIVLYLLYGYADNRGLIKEGSGVYKVGRILNVEPPNSDEVAKEIFTLTNQERNAQGLPALKWDKDLSLIASEHSQDMSIRNFFEHENLEGLGPTERAKAKGIPIVNGMWIGIAENIGDTPLGNVVGCGSVSSELDVAKCAVDGWMSSPGHRANILNKNYEVIGVGTYCTTSKCLNTQDFR